MPFTVHIGSGSPIKCEYRQNGDAAERMITEKQTEPTEGLAPENSPRSWQWLATEGLIIAAITIGGYALAHYYEAGYLGHFGVPSSVAEISISQIIVGSFAVLTTSYLASSIAESLLAVLRDLPCANRFRLGFACFCIAFSVLLAAQGSFLAVWAFGAGALLASFEFLFPLITQWRVKGYWNKLRAQEEHDLAFNATLPSSRFVSFIPEHLRLGILALCFVPFVAYAIGDSDASRTAQFWIDQSRPDEVVVRSYNTRMICCKIVENKIVSRNYSVREIPFDANLIQVNLGRLSEPPAPVAVNHDPPARRVAVGQ